MHVRLMMQCAQRPLIFHGYRLFECNLPSYTTVNDQYSDFTRWIFIQFQFLGGQKFCINGNGFQKYTGIVISTE